MVTIKITRSGNIHTFTFQDSDVDSVQSDVVAQPDIDPMPYSGPADAIAFDINGAQKNITISGALTLASSSVVTGTGAPTVTSILNQKQWLEALVNGDQSGITFTSTYESLTLGSGDTTYPTKATIAVITKVSFTEETGNPSELKFTMNISVGDVT